MRRSLQAVSGLMGSMDGVRAWAGTWEQDEQPKVQWSSCEEQLSIEFQTNPLVQNGAVRKSRVQRLLLLPLSTRA
jgi:hypothetical protein